MESLYVDLVHLKDATFYDFSLTLFCVYSNDIEIFEPFEWEFSGYHNTPMQNLNLIRVLVFYTRQYKGSLH